jgi:mannose-1-phosphate guanylyltransferase
VHVQKQHPDAVVAVFPSDHFVFQEDLFMAYVRRAFETAEESPAKIVFLGAEPGGPEPEYGYILPDPQKPGDDSKDQSVKAFVEEPETRMAARLISLGALWNTMVMVFRAETLLHLLSLSTPKLHSSFQRISKALGSPDESSRVTEIYRDLRTQDFCKDLIGPCDLHSRNQFSVLSMRGLFWSDWGSTSRIFSTLEKLNALDRIRSTPWRGGFSNSFSGAAEDAQPAANF